MRVLYVAAILMSGILSMGSYNKATGKDEIIFIPVEKEKSIGASIDRQVSKEFEAPDDPLLQVKVDNIGAKVAAVCDRRDLNYHFKVLKAEEKDDYNAFSVPGGYVYIFDVLVTGLKTDEAVAAVLAHEVAHIVSKDSIKRLQSSLGMNVLMLLGLGSGADPREVREAGYALSELMMSYSREAELLADKLAVKYLIASGYDPEGVVSAIQFMRQERKKGPILNYIFMRSHPYLSERLSRAKAEVNGSLDFDSYINLPTQKELY